MSQAQILQEEAGPTSGESLSDHTSAPAGLPTPRAVAEEP